MLLRYKWSKWGLASNGSNWVNWYRGIPGAAESGHLQLGICWTYISSKLYHADWHFPQNFQHPCSWLLPLCARTFVGSSVLLTAFSQSEPSSMACFGTGFGTLLLFRGLKMILIISPCYQGFVSPSNSM